MFILGTDQTTTNRPNDYCSFLVFLSRIDDRPYTIVYRCETFVYEAQFIEFVWAVPNYKFNCQENYKIWMYQRSSDRYYVERYMILLHCDIFSNAKKKNSPSLWLGSTLRLRYQMCHLRHSFSFYLDCIEIVF